MRVNFEIDKEFDCLKETINQIYLNAIKEINIPENIVVNIVFVSPEKIQEMNKTYRNIDRVTDVLSFPMLDDFADIENEIDFVTGEVEIGDIYINPIRAKEQAIEYGHSYKREICFLALHGFLHLCLYDHIEKEDEKIMFELQDRILEISNIGRD